MARAALAHTAETAHPEVREGLEVAIFCIEGLAG
jgi:hypothetical protein